MWTRFSKHHTSSFVASCSGDEWHHRDEWHHCFWALQFFLETSLSRIKFKKNEENKEKMSHLKGIKFGNRWFSWHRGVRVEECTNKSIEQSGLYRAASRQAEILTELQENTSQSSWNRESITATSGVVGGIGFWKRQRGVIPVWPFLLRTHFEAKLRSCWYWSENGDFKTGPTPICTSSLFTGWCDRSHFTHSFLLWY